jgi:hypothetical protein
MKENVLIIFASGGSGLKQAAEAKKQEILLNNPKAKIIKKDILLDWVGKPFGYLGAKAWDYSQKKGDIAKLEKIRSGQVIADYVFWPSVFFKAYKLIMKEDITRVIDTQPICTAAIIKAIRLVNYYQKKNLQLEKISVDLPTDLNTHFLRPIKKLSKNDRKYLKLFTIEPLLKDKETEEQFWIRNCNLSLDRIYLQKYFIRQSFIKYQQKSSNNALVSIKTKCHDLEEISLTENILKNKNLNFEKTKMVFKYHINPDDLVYTILLGSQPAHYASIAYLKGFLKLTKFSRKKNNHIIFIFCSKLKSSKNSLFSSVYNFATKNNSFKNLIIIPLSFQDEDAIAPIFSRSDVTFTRSGGQTAMELMGVMRGQIFIHSEVKGVINRKKLLKGMFAWESGNAQYLEKMFNAIITTPKIFENHLKKYF